MNKEEIQVGDLVTLGLLDDIGLTICIDRNEDEHDFISVLWLRERWEFGMPGARWYSRDYLAKIEIPDEER